jgi:competence protein ComEC
MESLALFQNKKERLYFLFFALVVFLFNLNIHYTSFKHFKKEEIFQSDARILNIYSKKNYQVLKLKTDTFTCFTSTSNKINYKTLEQINLYLLTKDITFLQYLKGFYTKSFNLHKIDTKLSNKQKITNFIDVEHKSQDITSLYNALFLAISVNSNLRDVFAAYGISHLIAISGFHLGVISFVLYFLLHIIYKPLHQHYFPYRNKRFDLLIVVCVILFAYLLFVDIVPSLLRSFVMFVFGIFLLRNNIKLFSFETLFITVIIIISLFPKLLFSLSLWFSIAGVFYIYLYIHYFKKLNKYLSFILFNFWIYLSLNPITHYFFGTTAIEQLYSPILTLLFTLFYPLSIVFHLFSIGDIFDTILIRLIDLNITTYEKFTPLWFFILYLITSFLSIFYKKSFIILNIFFISFSFWIFIF